MSDSAILQPIVSERVAIILVDLQSILKVSDHYYNTLADLFEKLQLVTYEASDMMLDITFVNSVRYFSVITKDLYRTYVASSKKKGKSAATATATASTTRDPPTTEECKASDSSSVGSLCHPVVADYQSQDVVGMIYLTTPPETRNNIDGVGDLNIGIIICPQHQRKGYATKAIQLALDHAFRIIRCHRVQAIIVNPFSHAKYPSYRFFTAM